MDEITLVKKAKRGDAQAFGCLYEKVYIRMYKFALFTLKNPQDAEDVVSETVTDAFFSIKKLKQEEAFEGWIFAILSNKCKKKLKGYLDKAFELEEENLEDFTSPPADTTVESIDLKEALNTLDEVERYIIAQNIVLGYTTREISIAMRLNENTVRSKKSRALGKLRSFLKE